MMYYIHGYKSNPNSSKAILFKEKLNAIAIEYHHGSPEDLIIFQSLKRIAQQIGQDKRAVLIGSSLGGFLAAEVALENPTIKSLVLLNPVVIPPSQDVNVLHGVPNRILSEMKDERLFRDKIHSELTILVATDDEMVPRGWTLEFAMAQEATVRFLHDDHRFTHHLNELPNIIQNITKSSVTN